MAAEESTSVIVGADLDLAERGGHNLLWKNRNDAHVHDTKILETVDTEGWVHACIRIAYFAHLHGACHVPDRDDVVFDPILQE